MTQSNSNAVILKPAKRPALRWLRIVLAGVALLGVAVAQSGKGRKVSPDLDGASQTAALKPGLLGKIAPQMVDVIVQFRHPVTAQHLRKVDHLGGKLARQLASIRGGNFLLPLAAVQDLALDGEVAYISPNRKVRLSSTDHFRETVGADIANNNGWTGQGITVAVIDSGISDHPDLYDQYGRSRVIYNESFVQSEDPSDRYGHGTHVAGIIAGNGASSLNDSNHVLGVSPDVYLVNLKVLDQNGNGNDAQTIAAIERAISLKDQYNIKVINLSQGRGIFEGYAQDPLCQAVEAAYNAGIVVVVSAGNYGRNDNQGINGYGTITAPGNDPFVITVGAMNTRGTAVEADDLIATYSSRGPTFLDHIVKPDIVAPGNQIVSLSDPNSTLFNAVPQAAVFAQTTNKNSYYIMSGTSMAAPVVSGAVTLMLQKDPTLSPDTVKGRLMGTANKNFVPGYTWYDATVGANRYLQQDLFTVGAGYLNIPAALASTDTATTPAASPSVQLQSDGTLSLVGNSALGNLSGVWNASTLWGNVTSIEGSSVVWTSGINANSVIWTFQDPGGGSNQAIDAAQSVVWTVTVVDGVVILSGDGSDNPVPLPDLSGGTQ